MTVVLTRIHLGSWLRIDPANDNPLDAAVQAWGLSGKNVPAASGRTGVGAAPRAGSGQWPATRRDPADPAVSPLTLMRRDMSGDGHDGDPSRRVLRLAVGIATVDRPQVARTTVDRLSRQSRRPDQIAVSIPTRGDFEGETDIRLLIGARGLTAQRNAILDAVPDADVICFFDDDFIPHTDYLKALEEAFLADPTLVGGTGLVVADGIIGPGYSAAEADRLLESPGEVAFAEPVPVYSAYGCNMAFRLDRIRAERLRFDERLPAYGWLEDVDFSRRVARFGSLAQIRAAVGVHLGVKGGRQSGRRFGYSQVANPIYLVRKGSYDWHRAAWLMGRNIAMNLFHAPRPEPHIDRRGRLAGNIEAFADILRGRLNPARIAAMS